MAQDVLPLAVGGQGVVVVVVVVPSAVDLGLVVVSLHAETGMAFRLSFPSVEGVSVASRYRHCLRG